MELLQVMLNFHLSPESPGLVHGLALVCLGLELVKILLNLGLDQVQIGFSPSLTFV